MPKKKLPEEVLEYFRQQGRIGGKLGGAKAWEKLTPKERSARAKHAVAVREAKQKTAGSKKRKKAPRGRRRTVQGK
ncbi:MAG: hypothetical protein ACRD4Q_12075 [Candidatus Acidiferrales bacterium]